MKRVLLYGLLALATAPAFSDNTILPCSDDRVNTPVKSWLPNGATSNACHQMVLGAGMHQALEANTSEQIAAFKENILVGVRAGDRIDTSSHDMPTYQPGDWIETGSTPTPGELWWGRTATRHIFAGQETGTRMYGEYKQWPVAEQMKAGDHAMRRAMAMVQKQPMVSKPGDEKFQIFASKQMSYTQYGATHASFEGGSGGDGQIPPGMVSNATLQLETSPAIKGMLSFTLMVDGKQRQFTFPVTSEPKGQHDRLHAATAAGTGIVRCSKRPGRNKPYATAACEIQPETKFVERYDATGAFFGDRASLVALQFILTLNSPDRNRHGATATGIIVLKTQ